MPTRIVCPTCKQPFLDEANSSSIEDIGECLRCDHIRGDILDSRKVEVHENKRDSS